MRLAYWFREFLLCGDCRADIVKGDYTTLNKFRAVERTDGECEYCGLRFGEEAS